MTDKSFWIRFFVGGFCGMGMLFSLGGVVNDMVSGGLIFMGGHTPFRAVSENLTEFIGSEKLALVVELTLYFALGAAVGIATLPFADDTRKLLGWSLTHFVVTAVIFSVLVWLCGWNWHDVRVWVVEVAILAGIYLGIWFVRWVGWYFEIDEIRVRLGLKKHHHPE